MLTLLGKHAPGSGFQTRCTPEVAGTSGFSLCVCVCVSEPSTVLGLAVTSRASRSLGLSWEAGPGRTQRFRLQLWDQWGLQRNETLESTATQHTLLGLTAGRLYNITMVTEAAGLQSSISIQEQTGRGSRTGGGAEGVELTRPCPFSARCGAERLRRWQQQHQGAVVMATARGRPGRPGGQTRHQRDGAVAVHTPP